MEISSQNTQNDEKRSSEDATGRYQRDWSFFVCVHVSLQTLDVKKINKNHKLTISAINICLSSFNGWHEAGLLFFFFFCGVWHFGFEY